MVMSDPITGICIVTNKNKCPPGFEALSKAFDEPQQEADVWKDGFLSFSQNVRYIAFSRTRPPNAFVLNVVADIAVLNDRDLMPPGFVPVERTQDTNEKALKKKQLCLRSVPRDSAIDAVCDIILLYRQKKPPPGYTLAGDIDGLLLCFKFGTIPESFGNTPADPSCSGMYPGLPYPIHPMSPTPHGLSPIGVAPVLGGTTRRTEQAHASSNALHRQSSVASPLDGVPFEVNPRIKIMDGISKSGLPGVQEVTLGRLESEFYYPFNLEKAVLQAI